MPQNPTQKNASFSRKAFMFLIGLIAFASGLTCWWMTVDSKPTVRLVPLSTEFESYPVPPNRQLDRG